MTAPRAEQAPLWLDDSGPDTDDIYTPSINEQRLKTAEENIDKNATGIALAGAKQDGITDTGTAVSIERTMRFD